MKNIILAIISVVIVLIIFIGVQIYCNEFNIFINYQNSNFRSAIEITYFISSPLLLIVAVIGLLQLRISRVNSKIVSKREAYKITAEQCDYYSKIIIPLINEVDDLKKKLGIKSFGSYEIKNKSKGYEIIITPDKSIYTSEELISKILNVLNLMETFSLYFSSGVADEKLAFSSCGSNFCFVLDYLMPFMCGDLDDDHSIKLFILWNDRIKKKEALKAKIKAEEKINQKCHINIRTID